MVSSRVLTQALGKQARASQFQDDPTTKVTPLNVHQQGNRAGHYSNAAAPAVKNQNNHDSTPQPKSDGVAVQKSGKQKKIDPEDLARIVAEENESKGKLPRYPGLERWQLLSKMGDGAFSNVYRARDLEGNAGEVAIKVVRKFEMNSSQVSRASVMPFIFCSCESKFYFFHLRTLPTGVVDLRAMLTSIRSSKNSLKSSRCA